MENGKGGQSDAYAWAEQARLEAEAAKVRKMLTLSCSESKFTSIYWRRSQNIRKIAFPKSPNPLFYPNEFASLIKVTVLAILANTPRFHSLQLVENLDSF